jgi:serine/threonine protein kinase
MSKQPPWYKTLVFKQEIGKGSFGLVRLAQDPATNEWIAVKRLNRLPPNMSKRDDRNKRRKRGGIKFTTQSSFEHEVHVLRHAYEVCPNEMLKFFGEWQTKTHWYMAMEFAGPNMTSLNTYYESHVPSIRGDKDKAGLAWALIEKVRTLHKAGIAHRDIKPANILINMTGPRKCHLIDFGGAHIEGSKCHSTVYGTQRYMDRGTIALYLTSREERRSPSFVAMCAADIYALGLVLLDLMLGPKVRFYKSWITRRRKQINPKLYPARYPGGEDLAREFIFCGTSDPIRAECMAVRDALIAAGGPDLSDMLTLTSDRRVLHSRCEMES